MRNVQRPVRIAECTGPAATPVAALRDVFTRVFAAERGLRRAVDAPDVCTAGGAGDVCEGRADWLRPRAVGAHAISGLVDAADADDERAVLRHGDLGETAVELSDLLPRAADARAIP